MSKLGTWASVLAVVGSLAVTALVGGLGAAQAATLPTPTITLTGPASVNVGTPAQLDVTVTAPTAAGETVTLEKFGGLLWSTASTATLDASSHATFSQTPTKAGSTKYRVRIAATSTHAAATSASYTLSAVLATPTVTLTGPAEVVVNTAGVMTVSVTDPTTPGETVTLEKFGGLFWGSAGTATLDGSSHATFTKTPTALGSTRYRVKIAKTATHNAVTSAEYTMTAVAEPPPTPATDCGGVTPLKADGTPWVCTYNDEFNGDSLDRRFWVPQVTETSNVVNGTSSLYTCYVDSPDVITEHDGVLELSLKELPATRSCGGTFSSKYIAGQVSHYQTFSQTYGKYEVRAKLPDVRSYGVQETFWLWPVDPTRYGAQHPASGEIDFAEFYSRYPDLVIPYLHYLNGTVDTSTNRNIVTAYNCSINYGQFNTYGLEWYPGQLKIFVNGALCLENNYDATNAPADHPYAPFDQPFFLALTQAMGTYGNEYDTNVVPDTVSTQIDYARIWR
jgi:beta-glucanase (GH16 family)